MRNTFRAIALIAVATAGCASQQATQSAPGMSVLRGHLQQTTFPAPVSAVTVVSDRGVSTRAAVAANGAFSLELIAGTGYRFFLSADGKGTPLVLRSNNGHLDTGVVVTTGGAAVDLGAVSYRGGGARWRRSLSATPVTPAAHGTAAVSCSSTDGESGDQSDGEQSDGNDNSGGDCVDGLDAQTHQPCDGGPQANQTGGAQNQGDQNQGDQTDGEQADASEASASDAMGVAELDVPGAIGCSGGDGEEGDQEQSDGEQDD